MTTALRILSAGAAKGLVQALGPAIEAEHGVPVDATFDSAGAIATAAGDGTPFDLVILPAGMLDTLAAQASTTLVTFDFASDRPRRITPEERRILSGYADERVSVPDMAAKAT